MSLLKFMFPFLLFGALACTYPNGRQQVRQHSFYYWKTRLEDQDSNSQKKIAAFGISHFYIKYMDIDWSEDFSRPVPVAQLQTYAYYPSATQITTQDYTPVICITNRTFAQIQDADIDALAVKVTQKTAQITNYLGESETGEALSRLTPQVAFNNNREDSLKEQVKDDRGKRSAEIQIDCDWTEQTKERYFHFLRKMKEFNKSKIISATIRLYPYKYREKMGVPPVDKGLLMCYNLGNINSASTVNSIFDVDEMNKYLNGATYPVPLDIALPVFSWQAWFRGGKFKGIIHNKVIADSGSTAFSITSANTFRINTDTVIDDVYYREGDVIRTEAPDGQQLVRAADILMQKIPSCQRIAFFDWDDSSINKYETVIQKIFTKY